MSFYEHYGELIGLWVGTEFGVIITNPKYLEVSENKVYYLSCLVRTLIEVVNEIS